jgi:hypothetical protein
MEEATLRVDLAHVVFFADIQEVGCPFISHMLQH